MTADRFLHFIGARTGSPAAAPTRVARRGLPQTQRLHFLRVLRGCGARPCPARAPALAGRPRLCAASPGWHLGLAATAASSPWYNIKFVILSTDGVGTMLKFAFETGIHDTIGIDLVAMGVNDIVTLGAEPLLFLDSYITSKLDVDLAEKVIKGIVGGCQQSDCLLLGETAEMPSFSAEGEYDLSGFAVGVAKKDEVIDGKNIVKGDVLIGLPSSGVHSNGFSVARRVLEKSGLSLSDQLPRNDGITTTVGEALMAPTVIYVKQVLEIISKGGVKGLVHITGGGFTENIPTIFPSGLGAKIFTGSWEVPPVFDWLQQAGNIDDSEMRRTFNMGIGMVLVVSRESVDRIIEDTHGSNPAYRIGEVIQGEGVQYV